MNFAAVVGASLRSGSALPACRPDNGKPHRQPAEFHLSSGGICPDKAGQLSFTLWHYKAGSDRLDDVTAPGFFRDANDLLAPGDMMMVSAQDGGQILTVAHGANYPTLTPLR